MKLSIEKIESYAQCGAFLRGFSGDPAFSDPMLSSEEQIQVNLEKAIGKPDTHAVLGVYKQGQMVGLFSFLVLKDEQYIEMLVGLSRDADAYGAVFANLEQHHPGYNVDFVFNPKNILLREALTRKGAEFETEQQKMVLSPPWPQVDTTGVEPLTPQYEKQYFSIHNRDMYWTGEKVAASQDRFRALLAIEDGKVVGYLDVTCCFVENEPFDLLVLEAHRRKGWGRKLLGKALKMNKPKGMTLQVDVDNFPAIRLFTSMGFEKAEHQNSLNAHWRVPRRDT